MIGVLPFLANDLFAQQEKVLVEVVLEGLKLEQVDVHELVKMYSGFQPLVDMLGSPKDSTYSEKFSEALWVFKYEGFEMTYIQLSPVGPELLNITVKSPEVEFNLRGAKLFNLKK